MSAGDTNSKVRAAQAAARTLDILDFFALSDGPSSAAVIVERVDIPVSTLYGFLRLLRMRDYVDYDGNGRGWSAGHRLRGQRNGVGRFVDGMTIVETLLAAEEPLRERELAERAQLTTTAVVLAIPALVAAGVVSTGGDGTVRPGPKLAACESERSWRARLREASRPVLVRLRDTSGETASLVAEDGPDALYLDQIESRNTLRCSGWIGRRVPLAGTSVEAAFADQSRAHVVADAVETGVTAISCAVADQSPLIVVNVIGPSTRLNERGLDELRALVEAAAVELEVAYAAAELSR